MNSGPEQDATVSTPESGQEKQDGITGGSIVGIVGFSLLRHAFEIWLIEPFAFAMAILVVFPLMYPLEKRRVSLARWLLFSCLLAVLFPAVMYGSAYLLCGSAWGAFIYGVIVAAFTLLLMRFFFTGMHGVPVGSLKVWILPALLVGIAMGLFFHYVPETFCE